MIDKKQLRKLACHTQAHCRACRTDADWRENVTGVRDFECPYGVTESSLPSQGLGDTIAKATRAIGIKPCGGCKKRQQKLNKAFPYKNKKRD